MDGKPNVVWLTLDSVRADHTSMAGYRRDTTPNLARIAGEADGQWFSKCFASSHGTPISSASILTGTQPFRHGLNLSNEYVPDALQTVPELLSEQGYATAGLSRNSYVSSGTGLDRGFDRFKWIAGSTFFETLPPTTIVKYLLNVRRHSAGLTTDTAKHATPFLMNDVAKRWLSDLERREPFFLYAHYNEPHRPYYPPLPYVDRYVDDIEMSASEALERSMEVHENVEEIIANGYTLSRADEEALLAMYDAEIAYTDACVGRLFDHVESLDLGETVFVVTADHGELFGEHGLLSHKIVLDDAVTHVPMVVHGLDGVSHQADELVQHVDLSRTLVKVAGGPTGQFEGQARDLRGDPREYALSQRGPQDFDRYTEVSAAFDAGRFHREALTSLRTHDYRYDHSADRRELHRLPDEVADVTDDHPDVAAELRTTVEDWIEEYGETVGADRSGELSEDMTEQLRNLGYME